VQNEEPFLSVPVCCSLGYFSWSCHSAGISSYGWRHEVSLCHGYMPCVQLSSCFQPGYQFTVSLLTWTLLLPGFVLLGQQADFDMVPSLSTRQHPASAKHGFFPAGLLQSAIFQCWDPAEHHFSSTDAL
jgi:hypothetical protein